MKVFVVTNSHLCKDKKGDYYSATGDSYEFLARYLKAFDIVRFMGKVRYVDSVEGMKYQKVSGNNIEIIELPWYQGLHGMFSVLIKVLRVYVKAVRNVDCYIFRIGQMESFIAYIFSWYMRRPFAVEVINDPDCSKNIFIREISKFFVRHMCKKANGAAYVTEEFLQSKYPSHVMINGSDKFHFESHYTTLDLNDNYIYDVPIEYKLGDVLRVVHIANLIQNNVKGHEEVIEIVNKLVSCGRNVEAIFIGDGPKKEEYERYVDDMGLADTIHFVGRITNKEELLGVLRSCDLMILPTRVEGLPRSIIEAMAVGLPCLSTPVAGIPELLEEKYLFKPTDIDGFVTAVCRLMDNPSEMVEMSKKNLECARAYAKSIVEKRRTEFYKQLRFCVVHRN